MQTEQEELTALMKRARYLTRKIAQKTNQEHIEDMLLSAAYEAVAQCLKLEKREQGFKAYTGLRISGAIYDAIRAWYPLSRRLGDFRRKLEKAKLALGEDAPPSQLASHMGISLEKYYENTQIATPSGYNSTLTKEPLDIEDIECSYYPTAEFVIHEKEMTGILNDIVNSCSTLSVYELYTVQEIRKGRTLNDIAVDFGYSASRISQMRASAIKKLQKEVKRS